MTGTELRWEEQYGGIWEFLKKSFLPGSFMSDVSGA